MYQYGIVIFAIFGIPCVAADSHGCATPAKVAMVNGTVTNLTVHLGPILLDMTKTEEQKNAMILDKVCNDSMVRPEVDKIEAEIAACRALISMTTVTTLNLGDLSFTDLFLDFQGVNNFCECVPALMQAKVLNGTTAQLMHTTANGKYPIINVGVMCSNMPIKHAVMTVADNSNMCPNVWKNADILDNNNVILMNEFRKTQCNNFDMVKLTCAIQSSATTEFKNCITEAENAIGADDKRCERHNCVMNTMNETCGVGRIWYMHAVNMEKTTGEPFQLNAELCDTSGVTIVLASFSLLFYSVICSVFF